MVLQHRVPFLLSAPTPTMSRRPLVGQGLPCEALRSHSDTPHSVGFFWTCDRSVWRTVPDNTQSSQETDVQSSGGIRTRNLSKRTAADPHHKPLCHWAGAVFFFPHNS
jgi:hypothetical protein